MKILITGGCGFIGSHVAEELCRKGHYVIVLDDLSSGKIENLSWKTSTMHLDFIQKNVADESLLSQILPEVDQVFHFAAIPSVQQSILEPAISHENNLNATLKLLIAAQQAGIKRLIFASTCAVYGEAGSIYANETMPPYPMSPYALQKLTSEYYLKFFYQFQMLPTVSLRFFNVFGPRQSSNSPYSGVISQFCSRIIQNEALTIFGDGTQMRDFTYISDIVHAVLLCSSAPEDRIAGKCFNIARGQSTSLLELIEALRDLSDLPIRTNFLPARPGDINNSRASILAAGKAFAYSPQITLTDGLKSTLDFFKLRKIH